MLITLNGEATTTDSTGAYDFSNTIRSGFTLKPNSKIALVSASIERIVDIVIVSSTNGNLKFEINHTNAGGYNYTNITIPSGTYSYDTLLPEIETRLDSEFGSQGYLFNLALENNGGDDEIKIRWNVSDPASTGGLPELPTSGMTDSAVTTATPNAGSTSNKLTMAGATQNKWYMAACPNTMPNYKIFSVPNENNPKIGNFVEIGDLSLAPADDEGLLGVYDPDADLPDGFNNNVGAFAFVVEPSGKLEVYETKYVDTTIDYISGGQLWDISFNVGLTWKFVEYAGGDGNYDYVIEEQTGANEYYIKKVPGSDGMEAYLTYTNTGDPNNFDLKMTLNAAKTSFTFTDPAGAGAGTMTFNSGTPVPPQLSTNHGLAKLVGEVPAGSVLKNGGVMLAGWGKEGFVKYFIKENKTNPNFTEITITDPDRPSVEEMFGGDQGHQFDTYYGLKMTAGAVAGGLDNIDLLTHTTGTNNTLAQINQTFKEDNLTNYGCTITEEVLAPANTPSSIVGGASDGCASANRSFTRQPFRNATFEMIVNNTAGDPSGQFGLLNTTEFNSFTSQGATSGGLWNANANHRARLLWSASGFRAYVVGGFANGSTGPVPFATTGPNPKIELEVDGGGHIFFNYYKQADNYLIKYRFFTATNLIPSGEAALLHPYWVFTDSNTIQSFVVGKESATDNTSIVAFNPDTMRNVLGFNAGDYVDGNGARGFTSNRSLDYAEAFSCASPLVHINLKNLPITSLNGKTNRQEKCIAVVPRYDINNEEGGNVTDDMGNKTISYYEPYNMLYQPLDNAMEISMNELSVSILNNDGTFATDLECVSLCLDIQPNPVARLR